MRKLLVGVCLIVAFAFVGCASSSTATAFVYDPGIPEDQMSFLWVPSYVGVKQFDEKAVKWSGGSMSPAKVGVPSGEHTFIIDSPGVASAGLAPVSNKSFTKNFEKGKSYQLINQNGQIVLIDR